MAFFRSIFLDIAARHPDITADCMYVDATALRLVRAPWEFDVMVTENMFGDILSDLGAALMGGMGMALRPTSATVRLSSSRATGPRRISPGAAWQIRPRCSCRRR